MFHTEDDIVKSLLLQGNFGIERETLRVDGQGFLSQTCHPAPGDEHIVRDFCENQIEINTSVSPSAQGALDMLASHNKKIETILSKMEKPEYLWPFSNPPYIRNERDIPIAQFEGDDAWKTEYRNYLSDHYGRYKMAFSGIHVNYSFSDELLMRDFDLSPETDFSAYKNRVYLDLAIRAVTYGWILVATTAASPILDSSFVEKGKIGEDIFLGLASVRCSELGYWNNFSPALDYTDITSYANSIQEYVDTEWISAPSELYYPIRLKPPGINSLQGLRERGVSHIELRMYDLNPLTENCIDVRDIEFAQLLLVWLASTPNIEFNTRHQVQSVQNFKNAAHYDLKTVKIILPDGTASTVVDAAVKVIGEMREFYDSLGVDVSDVLDFQDSKFIDERNRYAYRVRDMCKGGFVRNGIKCAKEMQEAAVEDVTA